MMKLRHIAFSCIFTLFGCTASNLDNKIFSGLSHTDPLLKSDTLEMIRAIVDIQGCSRVESVATRVEFYEPSSGEKGHEWGREVWIAKGCSEEFPFRVFFTEDGFGGTYFTVSIM